METGRGKNEELILNFEGFSGNFYIGG